MEDFFLFLNADVFQKSGQKIIFPLLLCRWATVELNQPYVVHRSGCAWTGSAYQEATATYQALIVIYPLFLDMPQIVALDFGPWTCCYSTCPSWATWANILTHSFFVFLCFSLYAPASSSLAPEEFRPIKLESMYT